MSSPRWLAWIKPWMVAVVLTLVAAGGATGVYFSGQAQHRRDRAEILAWERNVLPAGVEAQQIQRSLEHTGVDRAAARTSLARDRSVLLAGPVAEVVRPAVASYVTAIDKALVALDAAGTSGFP